MKEIRSSENQEPTPVLTRDVLDFLKEGFARVDGRLPLLDENGDWISPETIAICQKEGWAEPVYKKTILKNLTRLRLTKEGREIILAGTAC